MEYRVTIMCLDEATDVTDATQDGDQQILREKDLPGSPSSDPRGVTGGRGRRRRRRRRRKVRRRRRRGAAFIKALVPFWRSWFIHICS